MELQPGNPDLWDGHTNPISMFGHNNTQEIDINNIRISLMHISNFIRNSELKNNKEEDIPFLNSFGQTVFKFISSLFKGRWNVLKIDINNKSLYKLIKEEFSSKVPMLSKDRKSNKFPPLKLVEFTKLPFPQLPLRPSKEVLEKSKFYRKNIPGKQNKPANTTKLLYIQVLSKNINNILKIKEIFPKLSNKKIKELNKLIFNNGNKLKPKINMMIKGPSCKQVIISIGSDNSRKFMSLSDDHIANLNHACKGIKSDTIINFIHVDYRGLIITSNKFTSLSDISTINKYLKNCSNININDI